MSARALMMAIALSGANLASAEEVAPTDIVVPIEEFRVPGLLFVCSVAGLPTVGILYDADKRHLNFNHVGEDVAFHADNAVKTVRMQTSSNSRTWNIAASGPAMGDDGPLGYDFQLELVIREKMGESTAADWMVQAGSYSRQQTDCKSVRIPGPITRNSK